MNPKAKVIGFTHPYLLVGVESPEHLLAYCARISNPTNQTNEEYRKLILFLLRNKHWSPFDMIDVTIEVSTTRDIGREMLRHWSFKFQEFSQRYAEVDTMPIYRECRLQDTTNRQSSLECDDDTLKSSWYQAQRACWAQCYSTYLQMLDAGVAKEVARAVLPEGMCPTTIIMKGSVRSWLTYLEVRLHKSTQKEHREVAKACALELMKILPVIMGAVNDGSKILK